MTMDNLSAKYLEKYQEATLGQRENDASESETESLSEILDELEGDDFAAQYREKRLQQLKTNVAAIDSAAHLRGDSLGSVQFAADEKEAMDLVTRSEIVVVHFYQPTFPKCQAMNSRLALLAEKHLAVAVVAVQADQAPFLVAKLKIKVLPFVVVYKNGQELTRMVGFEGFGTTEQAVTLEALETRLIQCGAISRRTISTNRAISKEKPEESDDDWY